MNTTQGITEQDIQRALQKFRQSGRLIRRLPEQVTPRSRQVGAKHGAFENPVSSGSSWKGF